MTLHLCAREGFICPVYCLMPDHIHLIWMGLRPDSDQLKGMAFFRTYLEPKLSPWKFQHQAHDHVLREKERHRQLFTRVCNYILENPSRAQLIARPDQWLFSGSLVVGYPDLQPF